LVFSCWFCLHFFFNGMVFRAGRGGGQLGFPMQSMPTIGLEVAGGGTAGLAQLGIVVFELGGVGGSAVDTFVGAGGLTQGVIPRTVGGFWSVTGAMRHAGMWRA